MQASQVTFNVESAFKQYPLSGQFEFAGASGPVSKFLTRIFGCWHMEMSRPITRDGETYRACLDCGAHRKFDTQTWETLGSYYYH